MQNGSLESHLNIWNDNLELLSWDIQLKIAIGAARGLAFLHASTMHVICGDFKTLNILLDGDYNAKISYFVLKKFEPSNGDPLYYHPCTPESNATGNLYTKSDVYGFGVVLLEMLNPSGRHDLVYWIKPSFSNERKLKIIMDMQVEGQYSSNIAALQVAQLALKCIESDPKSRPSMRDVVEALEGIEVIEKPKKSKSNSTYSTTHGHGKER